MDDEREHDEQGEARVYREPPENLDWYRGSSDRITALELFNVLLRNRWKILLVPFALAALVVAISLLQRPRYQTDALLMPESPGGGGQLSRFSGVAAQFGIDVPTGGTGQSPQFYADLLNSRRLLEEAVATRYRQVPRSSASGRGSGPGEGAEVSRDTSGATLVELFQIEAASPAIAAKKASGRLQDAVSVSTSTETGLVHLSVTLPWPSVAKQVAERLIDLVNYFNNRVRQSQASEQATFIRERLEQARAELRAAEDSLETFLERNASWQQSPELRFRHDRLQRRVSLNQEVYTSLASRYEEARIAEVKNTPVVTTVTRPQFPVRPESKQLLLRVLVSLIIGAVVAVLWAFVNELLVSVREKDSEEYHEFLSLKRDARAEVRHVGQKIRRFLPGGS